MTTAMDMDTLLGCRSQPRYHGRDSREQHTQDPIPHTAEHHATDTAAIVTNVPSQERVIQKQADVMERVWYDPGNVADNGLWTSKCHKEHATDTPTRTHKNALYPNENPLKEVNGHQGTSCVSDEDDVQSTTSNASAYSVESAQSRTPSECSTDSSNSVIMTPLKKRLKYPKGYPSPASSSSSSSQLENRSVGNNHSGIRRKLFSTSSSDTDSEHSSTTTSEIQSSARKQRAAKRAENRQSDRTNSHLDELKNDTFTLSSETPQKKRAKGPKRLSPTTLVNPKKSKTPKSKAKKSTGRGDHSNYSTCHQCKQKTADAKTSCARCTQSSTSIIRGSFCGSCLLNRYGQCLEEALKNPQWICPMCLDECNCSSCRRKLSRSPVRVTTRESQKGGYKSVFHMLHNLEPEARGFTGDVSSMPHSEIDRDDDDEEEEEEEEEEDAYQRVY